MGEGSPLEKVSTHSHPARAVLIVTGRWMYQLFLSLDANFRLKRRKVSTDANDPTLNNGCAYIVAPEAYKAFLTATGNIPTEKHAHCNNHNAVKLANLKDSAILAATGVGAVDCARHGFRRPCSVGDLQKGERYVIFSDCAISSLILTCIDTPTWTTYCTSPSS